MSTRRLVIPGVALTPGERRLDREAAHHARVLRLTPGARLALCDGQGQEAPAEVVALTGQELLVRVLPPETRLPPDRPPLSITLIQGLPKGERMDWIIQKCTELGVSRVVIASTARAVPRPGAEAQQKKLARWQKIAREAARQSNRRDLPELCGVQPFAEALSRFRAATGLSLVFDGSAGAPRLRQLLSEAPASVTFAIGPEGGLTPEELAEAKRAGFSSAWLGERILRTETAAVSALAILQHMYGDLG